MDSLQVFIWATVGSVVSLAGGILLLHASRLRQKVIALALPFGAGTLIAAAFVSTLPEALEGRNAHEVLPWALAGFLTFFVLERLVGWFHHHHHDDVHGNRDRTHTYLVVIGDTLHNFIDGIAIGAAFIVNPTAGIAMSIAVAAHEVPQEIGDFGILLAKGMSRRRVILVNLISAVATIVAAMATYWFGGALHLDTSALLAVAAGFFIYIAASDLIPDIHEKPQREGTKQAAMLLLGVVTIVTVVGLLPHSHVESAGSVHDEHSEVHQD
ncbi:ZIP family metal transporter [Candidatus Saccharibacteria bacterium]|nr:ZIP family metal transporter [Candidatus Saccharibacteria bacterium]